MGVSALRIAACAGLLAGALLLGHSASGVASAEPGGADSAQNGESSKAAADSEQAGPSARETNGTAGQSNVTTVGQDTEPPPDADPGTERGASPYGSDSGAGGQDTDPGTEPGATQPADTADSRDGSDYIDNTVMSDEKPAPKKQPVADRYSFRYYLLELRRRGGGDWWNADRILERLEQAVRPYLPAPRKPEPAPGPAFRGGAPEAPVLDAGGDVSGGSDYQATTFDGPPILRAPVVVAPVPPAGVARFGSPPPAAEPGPAPAIRSSGSGAAAPRDVDAVLGPAGTPNRSTGSQNQSPVGTVTPMSRQTPHRGYTNFLRSPGLPQLAGAALPGVAGILLMTLGGGVIGYRQASAGRTVRTSGAARFLP